jgi:hypothetical protein
LLPLLGLGLLFAKVRGWLPRQAWVVFVLTSALALGLRSQPLARANSMKLG